MKISLIVLFFITALLYASVGFGGGSTYNALLVMTGADYRVVPIIALACNIVVVSGNVWRYNRFRLLDWQRLWPLIVISVPAAWLGGRLPISETIFVGLLALALIFAGLRLLWSSVNTAVHEVSSASQPVSPLLTSLIGGGVGFYAGLVGIGGGIFLAPILHLIRWGRAKEIAAACSVFILVNSLSGLLGQVAKLADMALLNLAYPYWPLIPAVLIGGVCGNYLGIYRLPEAWIKRLTAILILYVGIRLVFRFVSLYQFSG